MCSSYILRHEFTFCSYQTHQKSRSVQKGSQRKSVSRASDGGASLSRATRSNNAEHLKSTTVPLKRASKVTDRLHPLFGASRISQDSLHISASPSINDGEAMKKLASSATALSCEHSKQVGQRNESDNSSDQFLPPIK